MNKKYGRLGSNLGGQRVWVRKHAGIADDASEGPRAARSDVQGHHRALAEPNQRKPIVRQAIVSQLGVEVGIQHWRRLADTRGPAANTEVLQRPPLIASWRSWAGLRRV